MARKYPDELRIEVESDLAKQFYDAKGDIIKVLKEDATNRQVLRALLQVWTQVTPQTRLAAITHQPESPFQPG